MKHTTRLWIMVVIVFLLFSSFSTNAEAQTPSGIIAPAGEIALISPPPSVVLGALESSSVARIFEEKGDLPLAADLLVDLSGPGAYPPGTPTSSTISAGTRVRSYFLHFDPVGGNLARADGSMSFDANIFGIIYQSASLDSTDVILGFDDTFYPSPGSNVTRGAELDPIRDSLAISTDLRTITFSLGADLGIDQIRVITAIPDPAVATGIVSSTGAVTIVSPPPSVQLGAIENKSLTRVFMEVDEHILASDLTVEVTTPGSYPPQTVSPEILGAGTAVRSYLFHFDPFQNQLGYSSGSVTFDNDVIGILVLPDSLDGSDDFLGAAGAIYPAPGAEPVRGAELELDAIGLSSDKKTVTFSFGADFASDQIRVLTAVANDPPSVAAGGPYTVSEGESVVVTASGSDPEGGPISFDWDLDGDGIFETGGQAVSFSAENLDGPAFVSISVRATDSHGLTATSTTVVSMENGLPSIEFFNLTQALTQLGAAITATLEFTDPAFLDMHDIALDWGDGSQDLLLDVLSPLDLSHTYAEAGVYAVQALITDDDGGAVTALFEYVVIFDPNGGFVTGAGWFESPAGALRADPTLMGMARFGFVSKYMKGASVPSGNTNFNFSVGELSFHSEAYTWLVITQGGTTAQFKGSGTINGSLAPNGEEYKFIIWANDGAPDTFRIKIWWEDGGSEMVVYDNGFDQAVGGGNIKIHSGN